jgi:hypothetical protein
MLLTNVRMWRNRPQSAQEILRPKLISAILHYGICNVFHSLENLPGILGRHHMHCADEVEGLQFTLINCVARMAKEGSLCTCTWSTRDLAFSSSELSIELFFSGTTGSTHTWQEAWVMGFKFIPMMTARSTTSKENVNFHSDLEPLYLGGGDSNLIK